MSEKQPVRTVVGEGTEFEGSVVSLCGIAVNGKLKGDITAPSLTVEATGAVDGRVRVETLVSQGEVSGEIEADSIELSGKVGDRTVLRASVLEVKMDGARVTFGNCELQVGAKQPAAGQAKKSGATQNARQEPVIVHAATTGPAAPSPAAVKR